ncbi:MAG TPA: SCO6880 family protein [Acidimicrobiales bacterium]
MARDPARYRFGPLERRGLVAGWRAGQIASVAAGLVVAILVLRARVGPANIAVAVLAVGGALALSCWPVAGRSGDEWLPTVARWAMASVTGQRHRRSSAPGEGQTFALWGSGRPGGDGRAADRRPGVGVPEPFTGLEIVAVRPVTGGDRFGVVRDTRRRTSTAVLELRGHNFALLGDGEKERRVGGWAAVLSSLARERPVVHRLQWVATTLPDDGRAVRSYLDERATVGPDTSVRRSYAALLAGAATCRHEVHLAVQVRTGRSPGRPPGRSPGGETHTVLGREIAALRRALADADVSVDRVLGAEELADLFRRAGRPGPVGVVPGPVAVAGGLVDHSYRAADPVEPSWPWPMTTDAEWGRLRTDGTWHATYWIAEWPRIEVGPDFLGPLLLGPIRRTVSVVMEPLSPIRAMRQAEQARTADLADAELRRRGGFLATARRARESELAVRREAELAEGHAAVRFSGFVTVTAPTAEQLAEACDATEQAAGQCRLELRRLYGDQEPAFTYTLPLGRGLR